MNANLFTAVKLFDSRSPRGNGLDFSNFLLWWMVMETYLKDISNKHDASRAITEVEGNSILKRQLQEAWNKISIQTWSGSVKYLYDKQPFVFRSNSVSITDPIHPDLIELLKVIYSIRGNLIHGNDNPNNTETDQLYKCCADILAQWVKYLVE